MSRNFILLSALGFALSAQAGNLCRDIHLDASLSSPSSSSTNLTTTQGLMGFNQSPALLNYIGTLVSQARLRSKVDRVIGFNNGITQPKAPRIEKVVRQETPYTVSLMGNEILSEAANLSKFNHIGLVYGDPHFGNLNTQPLVFRSLNRDQNRYTLVDLDECSLGVFSLDLARYSIFLKASFGDLSKSFGKDFENQFFLSYARGLKQESPIEIPSFVSEALNASPEKIREKVVKYASKRTGSDGKFLSELFEKGDLAEYKTKNMKAQFLEKMNFDRDQNDRKDFKAQLTATMTKALQSEYGERVHILDIAIPLHDSGGSAEMQRFLVSLEVQMEGKSYRALVEFKQDVEKAGWDAVIESPMGGSASRYQLALQATMEDSGPFLKVVEMNSNVSFLMRIRGNMDVESDGSRKQVRELSLFNAYMMGLFHGGQGATVSHSYRDQVVTNLEEFKGTVTSIAEKVLKKLSKKSGLQPPKKF